MSTDCAVAPSEVRADRRRDDRHDVPATARAVALAGGGGGAVYTALARPSVPVTIVRADSVP